MTDLSGRGGHLRLVALLMLVVAFGHFNRISMSVAGTGRLIPSGGISETQMGLVYSGFLLCYTLAMLPGGRLIDRYGPRAALAVLCGGSALFVALTGLTSWVRADPLLLWGSLMLVRCVMGVSNAPMHPAAASLVPQAVPPSQVSFTNGLVNFAACAGMAVTYYLFGKLMDLLDWPAAFYVSSGLTFLVFLTWITLAPRTADPAPHPSPSPATSAGLGDVLRHRGLICLTLSYGAMGYFQYLFFYWMEYYFKDVMRLDADTSRIYSAFVVLANGTGMVLGGWVSDRTASWSGRGGRALVPVTGLVGSAVVLIAGLLATQPLLTLACFVLAMGTLGLCEGPFWTTAVEIGGRRGGTAAALMNTGGNAGGLLSPVVAPQLSKMFDSWQIGMGMASVVVVLGAALWLGIDPRDRLDSPRQEKSASGAA